MYRIGYAPGAFDLLHVGHLDLFRSAKSRCDFLIAGVASDEIILQKKGAPPTMANSSDIEFESKKRIFAFRGDDTFRR